MSSKKIAIVTGSNKGIGYAIVKGLCEKFDGDVYLTARDVGRGQEAVKKLNALGFHPKFHQLDISDQKSVDSFRDYIKSLKSGIDVLVNNAAIAYPVNDTTPFPTQARETIKINYHSLLRVCTALFPLLNAHARVVNVSSSCGHLLRIPSEELRKQFLKANQEDDVTKLLDEFVASASEGTNVEKGWGSSAYVVSKVGVTAVTFIQQRKFDEDKTRPGIVVNAVHPGYVDTDMTSHKGPLTIEQGAEAPLFLALQPISETELKGKYVWCDKRVVGWNSELS